MALRGTLTHWKTRLLAAALKVPPCYALGLLEALWHTTAELAPSGNIGRLPNAAIAMEMFYDGDPDALVAALVESKHLERNKTHRLIVHDWFTHADYNTRRRLHRHRQYILGNDGAELVPINKQVQSNQSGLTRHDASADVDASSAAAGGIPEPEPEPEPEPLTGGRRGAAALPPARQKPGRSGEETGKAKRPEAGLQGAGGRGNHVRRQRNSLELGKNAKDKGSVEMVGRSKWLLAHVREFWVRLNVPRMRSKEVLSEKDLALAPWHKRDQDAAIELLYAWPECDEGTLSTCLRNRSISVELGYLAAAAQPSKWLRDIPSFLSGPLNRFNEPIPKVGGKYKPYRN